MTDRRRRVATLAGGGAAALFAAAAGGATWYYAERITEAPHRRPVPPLPDDAAQLVAVRDGEVVLAGPAADRPGWWGLVAHDGWARIGPPATTEPGATTDAATGDPLDGVVRPVDLVVGDLTPTEAVRLDPDAVPPDPTDLGLACEDTVVPSEVGDLPAWWFPAPGGPADRVAVLIHGRSGSRRETARWVPTFVASGWSCLAVSLRNAPGAPASPDGRSHLGATEWEDVAAALDAARARGGRRLVLFGVSMGGACIAELVRRRPAAVTDVVGVVLDAPVRHWGPVLRAAARQRGLPRPMVPLLLPPTMALAGARGRIDWRGLDDLADPSVYALPTLVFHGDADLTVPVTLSETFAEARRDVVTLHRVPGAGHVRTWNVDRDGCEAALTDFLEGLDADAGAPTDA